MKIAANAEADSLRRARRLEPSLPQALGFAAKQRSIDEYERIGLNPYHYAILALLDVGAPETQAAIADALGYDRARSSASSTSSRSRRSSSGSATPRPPPPPRPAHSRREAHARQAPATAEAAGGRVPRAARQRAAAQLHALLLELAELHEPRCAPLA